MDRMDIIGLNGNDGLHYEVTTMNMDKMKRLQTDLNSTTQLDAINSDLVDASLEAVDEVLWLYERLEYCEKEPTFEHIFEHWDKQFDEVEPTCEQVDGALATQVDGDHYKTAIQPIQYIHANDIGFCEGNVIKYVSRWRKKNGVADLQKAKHYIELLIQLEGDKK